MCSPFEIRRQVHAQKLYSMNHFKRLIIDEQGLERRLILQKWHNEYLSFFNVQLHIVDSWPLVDVVNLLLYSWRIHLLRYNNFRDSAIVSVLVHWQLRSQIINHYKKEKRPQFSPLGYPNLILLHLDLQAPNLTRCCLSWRKLAHQFKSTGGTLSNCRKNGAKQLRKVCFPSEKTGFGKV